MHGRRPPPSGRRGSGPSVRWGWGPSLPASAPPVSSVAPRPRSFGRWWWPLGRWPRDFSRERRWPALSPRAPVPPRLPVPSHWGANGGEARTGRLEATPESTFLPPAEQLQRSSGPREPGFPQGPLPPSPPHAPPPAHPCVPSAPAGMCYRQRRHAPPSSEQMSREQQLPLRPQCAGSGAAAAQGVAAVPGGGARRGRPAHLRPANWAARLSTRHVVTGWAETALSKETLFYVPRSPGTLIVGQPIITRVGRATFLFCSCHSYLATQSHSFIHSFVHLGSFY